ncbi:MAG: hypothetical protein UX21_C0052G0002 [Microgenomates group bacterium GW2011_GWC2_45_8]|nr:MAG: hypothetical protein UX21_C0052G0002 [Microgenomates group bacterium GW2011_GWC2_45_8]
MPKPDLILPDFNPAGFPAQILAKFEVNNSGDLLPPDGLRSLGALLTVNETCRLIFENQVGMSTVDWFVIASQKFGLE